MRISNDDRDRAVEQLQQALDEGRIELGEFDERAKAAYEAKTNAELDLIFDDLPFDRSDDKSVHTIDLTPEERAEREAAIQERVHGGHGPPSALRALIFVGCITTAIWAISSVASGELLYFWPIWPIIGLAVAACMQWGLGRSR
nr:DUF1707 domain-containing protein [Glycomyces sp. L485]